MTITLPDGIGDVSLLESFIDNFVIPGVTVVIIGGERPHT